MPRFLRLIIWDAMFFLILTAGYAAVQYLGPQTTAAYLVTMLTCAVCGAFLAQLSSWGIHWAELILVGLPVGDGIGADAFHLFGVRQMKTLDGICRKRHRGEAGGILLVFFKLFGLNVDQSELPERLSENTVPVFEQIVAGEEEPVTDAAATFAFQGRIGHDRSVQSYIDGGEDKRLADGTHLLV